MWRVLVPRSVHRRPARVPSTDRERLYDAFHEMERDPFSGDVRSLAAVGYRRRVGSYRIIFSVIRPLRVVRIEDVARRTSTTYRR